MADSEVVYPDLDCMISDRNPTVKNCKQMVDTGKVYPDLDCMIYDRNSTQKKIVNKWQMQEKYIQT